MVVGIIYPLHQSTCGSTSGLAGASLDGLLVQKHRTFLAMLLCPLSLWERVRVRVPKVCAPAHGPSPPALSRGERELGASALPKEVSWTCTRSGMPSSSDSTRRVHIRWQSNFCAVHRLLGHPVPARGLCVLLRL